MSCGGNYHLVKVVDFNCPDFLFIHSGLAFVFYFPFIFALNALAGVKYLGALVLSEWMNLVMKW